MVEEINERREGLFDGRSPLTGQQYNELLNRRDSKDVLIIIDQRMNDLRTESKAMKEHSKD